MRRSSSLVGLRAGDGQSQRVFGTNSAQKKSPKMPDTGSVRRGVKESLPISTVKRVFTVHLSSAQTNVDIFRVTKCRSSCNKLLEALGRPTSLSSQTLDWPIGPIPPHPPTPTPKKPHTTAPTLKRAAALSIVITGLIFLYFSVSNFVDSQATHFSFTHQFSPGTHMFQGPAPQMSILSYTCHLIPHA